MRNESWVASRYLAAAKRWATEVVVADQNSTDGTFEALSGIPGVDVFRNVATNYDESHRQKLLLERARRVEGRRVLLALDADEALSANCLNSSEWAQLQHAKPGTVLRFRWVNILPGFQKAWIPPNPIALGFVDDGSPHTGSRIHSRRVPWPEGARVLDFQDIVVLHFQYIAWDRVVSKHRWYQAWEHLEHRQKGPLQIFREYHHMEGSWDKSEIQPLRSEWLEGYDKAGIDFRSLKSEPVTWWDQEVVKMLQKHGPEHFRRIAIWDKDWNVVAKQAGLQNVDLSDPRSLMEKVAHNLLRRTQKHRTNLGVRGLERFLRMTGW